MRCEASTFGVKKYVLVFFMIAILSSCGDNYSTEAPTNTQTDNTTVVATQEQQEPILVSASIVPISSIVNTVGGDFVEVENIVPAGVSPHGFDLSAQKMAQVSKSEKVFMIGLEHIDGFLNKAVSEEKQVHVADGMELIEVK
jgi:zinc transport system substrate-binding protein